MIKKYLIYNEKQINTFFWQTTQQQEIDYIKESSGMFDAFEFKWSEHKKVKFPITFTNNYPIHKTKLINSSNYLEFVM